MAAMLLTSLLLGGCAEPSAPWEPAPPQYAVSSGFDSGSSLPESRFNPRATAAMVFFFVVLPCGLIAGWSLIWWLEHRRRAAVERAFDPRAPLANGHAVIVGQVELDEGTSGPAIAVSVQQRGREWQGKNNWLHEWRETSRTVRVQPFWVRLLSGQRVRVEPDERVALRDDLSRIERSAQFERVRLAELTVGETVHVSGSLFSVDAPDAGGAYRAMTRDPVLRPSRLVPMVVSTERPGETSTKRADFYRSWIVGIAVLALALPIVVFPTVTLLALTGETVSAVPAATRHWQVYSKPKNQPGYFVQHYALRSTRAVGGRTQVLTDECSFAAWSCVLSGGCPTVSYTVSALSDDVVQIGLGGQLSNLRAALLAAVALCLLLAFPIAAFNSRPWYLRRNIVDGGTGQLPKTFPSN